MRLWRGFVRDERTGKLCFLGQFSHGSLFTGMLFS